MTASDPPESGRDKAVSALATICLAAFAVPGTALLATLAILTCWLPRVDAVGFLARVWGRCLLASAGLRVEAEVASGLSHRLGGVGYVFISNHQSYFDIPALLASAPTSLRFAAKRSLFLIPVFGWSLKLGGFIPVDRSDRSRAREVWTAAGRRLADGVSVLFFPEGTRSPDGSLLPFQRGGFLVALKTGAPIVPVGIAGARRAMPRGRLRVRPGTIAVRYGAPVNPAEFGLGGKAALVERVRDEVARLAGLE